MRLRNRSGCKTGRIQFDHDSRTTNASTFNHSKLLGDSVRVARAWDQVGQFPALRPAKNDRIGDGQESAIEQHGDAEL